MKLSQGLRDRRISQEELSGIVSRDVAGFHTLMENKNITYQDYESLLVMVDEFEDMFEEIIKTQNNGKV